MSKDSDVSDLSKRREHAKRREIVSYARSPVPPLGHIIRQAFSKTDPQENITEYLSLADREMTNKNYWESTSYLNSALRNTERYSNREDFPTDRYLGAIKRRIDRLNKRVMAVSKPNSGLLKEVEELSRRAHQASNWRYSPKRGIEGRTAVFIFSVLGGIVLSAFSLRTTGNAIGSLTGTTTGLLGLILFVFGLAGLFFGRKK